MDEGQDIAGSKKPEPDLAAYTRLRYPAFVLESQEGRAPVRTATPRSVCSCRSQLTH